MAGDVTIGGAITRTGELIRTDVQRFMIVLTGLSALSILLDSIARGASATSIVQAAGNVVAQYIILAGLLRPGDAGSEGRRGGTVLGMVGVSILTTLGILFASTAILLPGIFLAVRWSLARPALIADEPRVTGAIRASWHATRGSFWPVLGTFLLIYLPLILGFAAVVAFVGLEDAVGLGGWPWNIVTTLLVNVCVIAGWYASVALYELATHGAGTLRRLSETFA